MNSEQNFNARIIRPLFGDENGVILMVTLIFVGILALLGATATLITTTDTKISGNYKGSKKALYVAEAGAHEARERLRAGATGEIIDAHTDKYQWTAYIGTDSQSQKKGYDSTNSMHNRVASLQTDPERMDYTVAITHQLDTTDPTKVLYWGDDNDDGVWTRNITTGENIYLITSYGAAEGSTKTVQLEVTRVPPITVKAALYTGTSANIQGNVEVDGNDNCGGSPMPGIATQGAKVSDTDPVNAPETAVNGDPAYDVPGEPNVNYGVNLLEVQLMADFLKKCADFSYSVTSATHTASTTPGPGDGWGGS